MGIFGALSTAVSGLQAQSFALQNISGNIANSQTVGYKRLDTGFFDLVGVAPVSQEIAGTVAAYSLSTNSLQGDLQGASLGTYMAVNGDGYFMVSQQASVADGKPVFGSEQYYTRRGDFQLNNQGYLVNGAGYYLNALPVDPTTGNISSSDPQPIQLNSGLLPAKPTTTINYTANLAKLPFTNNTDPDNPGSELLKATAFTNNPLTTNKVTGADLETFLDSSVTGGSVTVYDKSGSPVNVQVRWAKTDSSPSGTDTWSMFYEVDGEATGTATAWARVPTDFKFDAAGKLTAPATGTVNLPSVNIGGNALGNLKLDISGGLTQYGDENGVVKVSDISQDGYSSGELSGIAVDGDRVIASYSNGQTRQIAAIPLATFAAQNFLQRQDGGAFLATSQSGAATLGASGKVIGSALESSNTDIAEEFTKMIVTQQAYSANTRVITTSTDMIKEVVNMVR